MQKRSIISRRLPAVFGACVAAAVGPASADIQHLDDVIISFSLCVGNDCVSGESFGFDTFRLKENNLRLHFQDTSNSASFPTNDWRIVANDSTNGGASYLAFEDSTAEFGRYDLTPKVPGMLNKLEHAHINIAQLNDRIAVLEERLQTAD